MQLASGLIATTSSGNKLKNNSICHKAVLLAGVTGYPAVNESRPGSPSDSVTEANGNDETPKKLVCESEWECVCACKRGREGGRLLLLFLFLGALSSSPTVTNQNGLGLAEAAAAMSIKVWDWLG